jgi:CRP-like cAMP-binding protein
MSAIEKGVLDALPLLKRLSDDARAWAIRRFVPASFPFGSVIAAEGAAADAFYVLVSGRARVVRRSANADEIPVNVLRAGDSFGEVELFENAPRCSTVRASADVLALRFDATDFRALVDAHPDIRTYLELQLTHARLQAFFRHVPSFARLPPAAVVGVSLAEVEPIALNTGDIVYQQGATSKRSAGFSSA